MGDHMFRDLALSRDNMVEYHKRIGPGRAAEQRLTVMVLQQSFWPFSSRTAQDAIIPVSVRRFFPRRNFFILTSYVNRCKASSTSLLPSTMRSIRATRSSGVMHSVRSACEPTSRRDKRNFQYRSIKRSSFYFSTTWQKFHFPTSSYIQASVCLRHLTAYLHHICFLTARGAFYYVTRSCRGCGATVHAPELSLREEKSAQETPRWKRRERRGRLRI
jgi:hypothetical protein